MSTPAFLTAEEAAGELNVSLEMMVELCAQGTFPAVKVGRNDYRIPIRAFRKRRPSDDILAEEPPPPDPLVEQLSRQGWRSAVSSAQRTIGLRPYTRYKTRQVPPAMRFEVLARDHFTCQYCGTKAPQAKLHVDHVIPFAEGGPTCLENLVTACGVCNLGKGDRYYPEAQAHAGVA